MACRNNPPQPPRGYRGAGNESNRSRTRKRSARTVGFARFFSRQLLLFAACAFLIMVVDFILYAVIAIHENDAAFNNGTPATVMRTVNESLAHDGGAWSLGEEGAAELAQHGAWAMVVDAEGLVAWSQNLPDDVPVSYSLNSVAMATHYANVADYPAFFWDRDDGLLVVGFPKGEFWTDMLTYPTSSIRNFPLYVLLVFAVDVAILFLLYAASRRRTQNAVGPIADALDRLSEGRSAYVRLKGDLREIGEQLTETSALIEQKDAARADWIRGVSHDIRTPLSMILGYADGIAQNDNVPQSARGQASVIRAQGLRIKDLVTDLNTASQLDCSTSLLNVERVALPRLARSIAAAHANAGLDVLHPVELHVADDAAACTVLGDERLLERAIENVLANARLHNENGCTVELSLRTDADENGNPCALVRVSDNGAGMSADQLAALEARLARARTARSTVASSGEEHGLGLVLVDRIARKHHGSLRLESAPNKGFTVELRLPIA